MSIEAVHPLYTYFKDSWELLRDFYEGEAKVKSKTTVYLKPTAGMELDGMKDNQPGKKAYDSYLWRASFHEHVADAVTISLGLMWQKSPVFELPKQMEYLLEKASNKAESLNELLQRINSEQLVTGRLGLLADLPLTGEALPYIALYKTESITNWDESSDYSDTDKVNMVVLDESSLVRQNFSWTQERKYRYLTLENGYYQQELLTQANGLSSVGFTTPMLRGQILSDIPFIFVNSKDLLPEPEYPPLIGLANKAWAIYRGEADYRQSLFMQGQDTLVVIGSVRNQTNDPLGNEQLRIGAGARIDIDTNGDAKFIGVASKGLSEQRTAIENDDIKAEKISGRFIGDQSNVESGKALTVRLGAQTASLYTVAKTSAQGLEKILKIIAVWMNLNPDEVKVIPNLDFTKVDFQGQELVNLMTARSQGAPISLESLHGTLVDRGLTNLSFEEELVKIAAENIKMGIPAPADLLKPASQPNRKTEQVETIVKPKG